MKRIAFISVLSCVVCVSAWAKCVPDTAKISFSCGEATVAGTLPSKKTVKYGAEVKSSDIAFASNICTAPTGKVFGGYIISIDDGSAPDVIIPGPLSDFKYYYTSNITIKPRWIPDTIDSEAIVRIANNPVYYAREGGSAGAVTVRFYEGRVKVLYRAATNSYTSPNTNAGYIMPDDFDPSSVSSSGICYCRLPEIDGIISPWVYSGGSSSAGGTCASPCENVVLNNFRSLAAKFLTNE